MDRKREKIGEEAADDERAAVGDVSPAFDRSTAGQAGAGAMSPAA
jgi:hypothetical protein